MPVNVTAKLSLPKFGTKQVGKKPAAKKGTVRKSAPVSKKAGTVTNQVRAGGAGYRKFSGEALWLPNTVRPEWLDGSLPGMLLLAIPAARPRGEHECGFGLVDAARFCLLCTRAHVGKRCSVFMLIV